MTDTTIANLETQGNWRTRFLMSGTVLGALLGVITAYLLIRTAEERGEAPQITTGDALKTGISVIGLMRSIATLGNAK